MELVKLCSYFRVERSTFLSEHFVNRQNSLYLTEKGVYEYTVNGQTYQTTEAECVFYKKGSYYDRAVLSPVVLHIFELDEMFLDSDGPISFFNRQRIYSNISLLNGLRPGGKKNLPYIEHLLNDILHTYEQEKTNKRDALFANDKRIEKALSMIRSDFGKGIQVSDIAKSVHLSYPQFNRLFVKQVGMSPIQYINQLRVDKAKALLHTTDLPIKAVAAECGFRDIYYFSNFFKAAAGISPTKYRAEKY